MSIEANMQGVIENRKNNFYSQFDVYAYTTDTYTADPTSEFYGLTALEILEEEELFGGVPKEVLEWAKSQKLSQRFVSQGDPDFDFIPEFEPDTKGPADPKPTQTAEDIKKEKLYTARKNRFKGLKVTIDANTNIYYTDDESSDFFGYTYDEILGMYANGVSIPAEILDWANAMADENSTVATEDTEGSDAQTLYTTLKNSPLMNIKTITKIFVVRSDKEATKLEEILESLEPIEREMAAASLDAEAKRKESVKNIEALTKEWLALEAKIKNGEQLESSEQQRFDELQELFGQEDENYQEGIDQTTKNYNKFSLFLDTALAQSEVAMDFGNKTIEVAAELADFEKTHKSRGIFGGIVNMGLGGILSSWGLAGSKNFSQIAHTVGEGTVHFSMDVQSMISEVNGLMSQTAENAKFDEEDPTHTVEPLAEDEGIRKAPVNKQRVDSNDGLRVAPVEDNDNASDVVLPTTNSTVAEGDSTEGTEETEEPEQPNNTTTTTGDEEQVDNEQLETDGEKNLEDVNAKELSHPKLKRLIQEEGKDSEKKGKEAIKLVEDLKVQAKVVDEKEEEATEANAEVTETSTEATEEDAGNTDNSDNGMTEDGAEDVEVAETTAEQTVGELENESKKEELTVEGLRDTFKGFEKANKKYTKDVNYADKTMKEDIYTGSFTIAGGGYMTGVGIYDITTGNTLIATGTPMLSNPFTAAAGATLVATGTTLLNIGTGFVTLGGMMIAGGTALTVSAVDGLEINDITKGKIKISGEDIETATTNLDEFEATQVEATEGEENSEETEETDESEETEEVEDPYLSKEEKLLVDMQKGIQELPPMMTRANKEGQVSENLGKDNISQLTGLTRDIPSLIETTITFETEKQAKQAAEAAGETEEAEETTTQDPAEIYETYRTDFNADLKQNTEFRNDINLTQAEANTNLVLGAEGTAAGTARTALGVSEIALGTILAANFWNPIQVMIGLALIKKGTEDVALGSALLATGMALTVTSTATLATSAISGEKIDESTEKTNFALTKVDEIEQQINAAVQEQMATQEGGQDLSGMSIIELLTVIIANGIKSSTLGAENQEVLEMVKEQFPQILEKVTANSQMSGDDVEGNATGETEETPENAETAENPQGNATPEGTAQGAEGQEGGENNGGIFAPYINDYKKDLQTNIQYANEVKQAAEMQHSITSGFFLGAPVEKANAKITQSTEQTNTALDEVLKMEQEYNKAVEEAKQKSEEEGLDNVGGLELSKPQGANKEQEVEEGIDDTEYDKENAKIPEYNCVRVNSFGKITHMETAPAEISEDKVAEKDEKKQKKEEKKLAKKQKKQDKKVKSLNKEDKQRDKEIEKIDKEIEKLDKDIEETEEETTEVGEQGQVAEEETPLDENDAATPVAETQGAETTTLSGEATEIAEEMQEIADQTKAEAATKTAETQGIVAEMQRLNQEAQQDKIKMNNINNQMKQEGQKGGDNKPQQSQPAQPTQPQPQPQPAQPQPAPAKKSKKAKKAEPKAEDVKPENKPTQAPAQQPQTVVTEQEKPEGADKTQYASDLNKAPEFIGFVAQSDSLASGAVLVGKTKKTPVSNNKQTQNNNNQQNANKQKQVQAQRKANAKAKTEAKKEEKEEQQAQNKPQPEIKAAARTTQKPFDIASMNNQGNTQNGEGGTKITTLKQSAQQLKAQAFNRQAKLSAMAVRASNNVAETIRKEAEAQAEAARKQREEQEKQEKIAKIKEYAGYVQGLGGIITTTGLIVEGLGTLKVAKGGKLLIQGTEKVTQGIAGIAEATGKIGTGTTEISCGSVKVTIGATQEAEGAATVVTGTATIGTGTATETAGTVTAATGAALAAGVFTAPASPPPTTAGAIGIATGTATIATGSAMEVSGALLEATGVVEQGTGATTISEGTVKVADGTAKVAESTQKVTEGVANIATAAEKIGVGTQRIATGATIQSVGVYTSAVGAAVSAGADIANGNILGALGTIVGAAASVVGLSANVGPLAQAGIQLAASGIQLTGQLMQMNQNAKNQQGNGQQKKQPNQKKMQKIQNNQKNNSIINKTQRKQQTVGNRFNK